MGNEWTEGTLGDVAKVQSGFAFKSGDMGETGHPVIKIKNINPPDVDVSDVQRVPASIIEANPRIEKFRLDEGDILIAMTGATVGKVGRMPAISEPHYLNQRVGKVFVTDEDAADEDYVYYVLSQDGHVDQMLGLADGSAQPNISGTQIESLEVPLPPLPEQKAIAHILGTLDDKIELNRRMNATLEGMAQALFKSWFVDFDPVIDNALAAGNPIPDELAPRAEVRRQALANGTTQQGSFDHPTLSDPKSLFPAGFEFSDELGWIPEGWESKTSGELFDVRDGTHDSPKKSDTGKFLITSRHITGNTIDYSNAYKISDADFEEVNKRSKVDSYDILLTMIGTVGVPFIVLEEKINFAIKNVGLFKTGSDKTRALFFFTYLKTDFMKNYMESRLAGTTQKYLTLKILRTLPVVAPTGPAFEYFGSQVKPLYEQIHRNNEINRSLTKLRNTLLPKLISGELSVANQEQLTA